MARARGLVSTAATAAVVAVAAAAAIAATATTAAAASCAPRTVDGSVVVEAEAGGGSGGGWEPVTASGARGIMWKSWKAARSVDGPGQGVRSYTVEVMEGGYYRLLLRASGASVRDHNDFFFRLGDGARRVYPNGHSVDMPGGWVKVYQNHGKGEWAFGAVQDGGAPVTRWLRPGFYTFALSGRSSRAAIDKMILYKCALRDSSCTDRSQAYWAAVKASWQPSKCEGRGGGGGAPARPPPPPPAPTAKPAPAPKRPPPPTKQPAPAPAPPPSNNGGGHCGVYSSAGGVVRMPTAAAGGGGGWEKQMRGGRWALVFKPRKTSHSVDSPGQGIKYFRFRAAQAGVYRLALRMSAPHSTEHNDVWVKLGYGARMMQGNKVVGLSGGFVKVYQNRGGNQWVVGGVTKDFDGHVLLTRRLNQGEVFTVTLSGRSSKLAVADVLLWTCNSTWGQCGNGSAGFRRVSSMGVSGCA